MRRLSLSRDGQDIALLWLGDDGSSPSHSSGSILLRRRTLRTTAARRDVVDDDALQRCKPRDGLSLGGDTIRDELLNEIRRPIDVPPDREYEIDGSFVGRR